MYCGWYSPCNSFPPLQWSGHNEQLGGVSVGDSIAQHRHLGIFRGGKQTIVVDPKLRRIVVEDMNRFGVKKRLIPFSNIVDTGISYFGKKSNYVNFYYIILKLRNGEKYPLFAPGRFFEGGSDRSVMEIRRQRLEEYLNQNP